MHFKAGLSQTASICPLLHAYRMKRHPVPFSLPAEVLWGGLLLGISSASSEMLMIPIKALFAGPTLSPGNSGSQIRGMPPLKIRGSIWEGLQCEQQHDLLPLCSLWTAVTPSTSSKWCWNILPSQQTPRTSVRHCPLADGLHHLFFQCSGWDPQHSEEYLDPNLCCFATELFVTMAGLNSYSTKGVLSHAPLCARCCRNAKGKKARPCPKEFTN